jgi:hypothetical protein
MPYVRPRLNDYFGLPFTQEEADFAIPFLDEDLPLYVDPFLLWKSPSMSENALHTALIISFNHLGNEFIKGGSDAATEKLIRISECDEVGLGNSRTRKGKPIGKTIAQEILSLFKTIPQIQEKGLQHIEVVQLMVDGVGKDRISDLTCSLLKSHLVDYTMHQAAQHGIPMEDVEMSMYNYKKSSISKENFLLPRNPETGEPILLVPKRWLRYIPWINYDDYYQNAISDLRKKARVEILNYNRDNYDQISIYINNKEEVKYDCKNDPLFKQIPVLSMKRLVKAVTKLNTGKENYADKSYEDGMTKGLASLLYPQLDFAEAQSRTVSGLHIRDIIFYNNKTEPFLREIYDTYECKQIVVELKNVREVNADHVDQLNRYLSEQFGRFGIIFCRNKPPKNVFRNTIDLWSGHRKCILILSDEELKVMGTVYENKQRLPIEVLKAKYIEFTRNCPV